MFSFHLKCLEPRRRDSCHWRFNQRLHSQHLVRSRFRATTEFLRGVASVLYKHRCGPGQFNTGGYVSFGEACERGGGCGLRGRGEDVGSRGGRLICLDYFEQRLQLLRDGVLVNLIQMSVFGREVGLVRGLF